MGLAILTVPAHAAVRNWDGDTSVTWATAANWDTLPVNDITTDIARFNLATYGGNPVFAPSAATRSIAGVEIGSGNGAMTLTTTNLSIGASGITMEAGAAAASVGKFTVAANQTFTNNSANFLSLTGSTNAFTNQLTLSGSGRIAFTASGVVTGSGGIVIGGAQVTIANTNQFGVEADNNLLTLQSGSLSTGSRLLPNQVSITGDFTFATNSTAANGLNSVANKTTTGNRILTTTVLSTLAANGGTSITNGALQLGGNLELRNVLGGDNGARIATLNLTSGIDLGGADRTLTLSQAAGVTNIGLLKLNGNLTIDGAGDSATTLNGGFDTDGVNRTITFNNNGTGVPTLSGALTGTASTVTIAGSSTNARIGALTGGTAHAINVNSSTGGSFLFNGASTYSGGTTITNGVAIVATTAGVAGTSGALGTGATVVNGGRLESTFASGLLGSSAITVNGGELRAIGANTLVTNAVPITLNGGTLRGFNAATINYGGGAINVTATSTIVNERSGAPSASSMNQTFGTSVSAGNSQLNVTSTNNQTGGTSTVTLGVGTLTGNGVLNVTDNPAATNNTVLALTTLTATGAGNQIANSNGVVSVSGLTTVGGASVGTLLVNGSLTATGGVNVATNGTLGGSGTITGAVTTTSSTSVIAPGNSAGTLGITGTLNAGAGANFKFELGSTSGNPDSDLIAISGIFTGSTLPNGLVFDFSSLAPGTSVATPYTLLTFGSSTGLDYTDLIANTLPSGLMLDTAFGTNGFLINGTNLQAQFSVVPEPTTVLMLLGGLGMTAMLRRRRA